MDVADGDLFTAFGQSINEVMLSHREHLERKRKARCIELNLDPRWLEASSTASGPKTRWVDGTPEYSFHIYGLRKLFPEALFVHVVRDVTAVVRSLLHFHQVSGIRLVANEQEAYSYWLRTVKACLKAEEAYGPTVVHRLRYSSLSANPESAIRSLLNFVGEPYSACCLEPLTERINSSNVPEDFKTAEPATDWAILEEALRLSAELAEGTAPTMASCAAANELEAAFQERVKYMAGLDDAYQQARRALEASKSGPPRYPAAKPAI
jgi:hypothetical protein